MPNIYTPSNLCDNCSKITWNYNESTKKVRCKHCNKLIVKKLHGLCGGLISKDVNGMFVLEFKDYREVDTYPNWDALQKTLNELGQNEEVKEE